MEASSGSTGGRTDYIKWEEYFMGIAVLASQRSKDPDMQVGAVVVSPDKEILGVGYNGHPTAKPGLKNDERYPWTKDKIKTMRTKNICTFATLNLMLSRTVHLQSKDQRCMSLSTRAMNALKFSFNSESKK
jgi:dCMP deaminase